jgi:hypothetical protein
MFKHPGRAIVKRRTKPGISFLAGEAKEYSEIMIILITKENKKGNSAGQDCLDSHYWIGLYERGALNDREQQINAYAFICCSLSPAPPG